MLRPAVLALTAITGFTGLAYEVTWQKYLAILLGAHSEATASVLGLFLGGLSLGYWLFGALTRWLVERGRRAGRPAPLLLVYGAVEAGIGLYCLLFPVFFPLVRRASVALPMGEGALSFAVDVALAALLILPPATLMGGTIPILTQALARSLADATRLHALVYASNTAGAFAGTLATGFFLVHWLGLDGILRAAGLVNVGVGATFALMGLRRRELAVLDSAEAGELRPGVFAVYGTAALLVGFAMMVLQSIVIRMGGLAFGSSEYTFTMVVAVFVLCIALGSFAVSAFSSIGRHVLVATLWGLGLLFTGLYFLLETSPYWAHVLRIMFRDLEAAFYPFYAAVFLGILAVIGPAVVLSGATLPLLFHALRREVGDLGSQAGRLYSVNTVGSLLGALIGGYALLFWLDLHHAYRIALAAVALAATLVTLYQLPRIRFAGAAALLLGSLVAIHELPAWRPGFLMAGTFRARQPAEWSFLGPSALLSGVSPDRFSFYDDDPNTSVAVEDYRVGKNLSRSILVNGKSDGNTTGDYMTAALAALVPALFAEQPRHAFVVGFGTGVTAGEVAELEEIESVIVAEISAGVIAAAPLFDFANHGASHHPKIRFVRSDAYRALLRGRDSYDLIISEPSNPWVTGIEQLYSREFLSEARDRLTPNGVYCQWFHLYETSSEAVELVLKTYAAVFDHVAIWSSNYADMMLLGFRNPEPALDLARLEQRLARPDFRRAFARVGISDLATLVVHEMLPVDVANAAALEGPIHSLYHPLLSFEAGRGFFVGRRGSIPFTGYGEVAEIGAANSLLGRYLARANGTLPDPVLARMVTRACREQLAPCASLAGAWSRTGSDSQAYRALAERLRQQEGPLFVRRLASLLNPSPPAADGRISPAAAVEMTRLFMERYHHGAPFEAGALLNVWQHCGANPQTRELCKPGLRAAERLLLGDRPPDPEAWLTPDDGAFARPPERSAAQPEAADAGEEAEPAEGDS